MIVGDLLKHTGNQDPFAERKSPVHLTVITLIFSLISSPLHVCDLSVEWITGQMHPTCAVSLSTQSYTWLCDEGNGLSAACRDLCKR